MLIGNLIQHQFGQSRDWPFGAALCLALMVLTMIGLIFYRRYAGGETGAAGPGRGKETRS
jgi:spermidine/putrescine transport system permease protein